MATSLFTQPIVGMGALDGEQRARGAALLVAKDVLGSGGEMSMAEEYVRLAGFILSGAYESDHGHTYIPWREARLTLEEPAYTEEQAIAHMPERTHEYRAGDIHPWPEDNGRRRRSSDPASEAYPAMYPFARTVPVDADRPADEDEEDVVWTPDTPSLSP